MTNIKINYIRLLYPFKRNIPKRTGAYIITHTSDDIHAVKYVGQSVNLYNRICQHNKNILYIDLYITDNVELAKSLERILIELIRPYTNTQILSIFDSDKDLMKKLLEDEIIKEHISNNIIKIGSRYLKYIRGYEYKFKYRKIRNCITKTIMINNETHIKAIRKQLEFKENKLKAPTITELINTAAIIGLDKIKVETYFNKNILAHK